MLFSSPTFFVFFLAYFVLHLVIPARHRIWLIIVGSTVFYGWWNPLYVWVPYLLAFMAFYGAAWIMVGAPAEAQRRRLWLTVAGLLLPLLFFKYTNFIYQDVFGPVLGLEGKVVNLALPLGISFVTFTAISYVTDVYHGRFPAERSLATMCGYILFFPQLIAGPILRPHELIPQLHRLRRAQRARLLVGFVIFTLGLAKKLVFADQLAQWVDPVYAIDRAWTVVDYLLAIYGFSIQIYCDFSGYTDMAIGLGVMLGVRLPDNFLRPYAMGSVVDFWRHWHITLSNWLRDYLYIALGGNRVPIPRQVVNIFVTMFLGGLWHGASWTFAIWGSLHGIVIALTHLGRHFGISFGLARVPGWLKVVLTFHFVTFAWVFFRAPDLATVGRVLAGPFVSVPWSADEMLSNAFPALLIVGALAFHRIDSHRHVRRLIGQATPVVLWTVVAGVWAVSMAISSGSSAEFVYFEF